MSKIGNTSTPQVLPPTPSEVSDASSGVNSTQQTSSANGLTSVQDSLVGPGQDDPRLADIENLLPALPVPGAQMSEESWDAASTFGALLTDLGDQPMNTNDQVLTAFMKLMMLTESNESWAKAASDIAQRTMRDGTHQGTDMVSMFFAYNSAAGTEGVGSALNDVAEKMKARNQLMELIAGANPDQEARFDAFVELDKVRNAVAELVLDMTDKHLATNRASLLQHRGY